MWDVEKKLAMLAKLTVAGEEFDIEPGASFSGVVNDYSKQMGLSKVRVFLIEDGVEEEVSKDDAPLLIEEGMEIVVRPYEKAA